MNSKQEQLLTARNAALEKELAAKNRELEIEAALEEVRSRTMAMKKSEELSETAAVLFQQFKELGEAPDQITIGIINEEDRVIEFHVTQHGRKDDTMHKASIDEPMLMHKLFVAWGAQKKSVIVHLTGKELNDYVQYRSELSGLPVKQEDLKGHRYVHAGIFSKGLISISTPDPRTEETVKLLERFAAVFDGTYTRFLDLQKAEAQTREAKIETALEKVRSRSMGMQKSEELKEVIQVVYEQFVHLNIHIEHTGFVVDYKAKGDWHFWIADKQKIPAKITHPYFDSIWADSFNEAKEKGIDLFTTHLNFEEKNKFYQDLLKHIPGLTEEAKEFYFSCPGLGASTVLLENVALYIENFSGTPYSDEENNILLRFGKVFQQTYTRFLDLQKAEVQAREAQVQLALERVRAKTMAMQHSNELPEAANLLFQQVQALGMPAWSAGYCIWDDDKKAITLWMSSEGVLQPPFKAPLTEDPSFIHMQEADQRGETFYVEGVGGKELAKHYKYMRKLPVVGKILDSIIDAGHPLPTFQIFHCVYFSKGFLLFITYEPVPEAHEIFKRFGKVFDQTYTRFLDLQKAEAQAKEAKIEAALERTRTQSMIMQHSKELDDTLRVFHEQVQLLGIDSAFSFLWLPDEEKEKHIFWAIWQENENGSTVFKNKAINYPLDRNEPATKQCLIDWKSGEPVVSYAVPPEGVENYFAAWQELINGVETLTPENFRGGLYYVEAFMKYGCFGVMVQIDLNQEEKKILRRFAIEFERTYTRFLDLQKAEAQAREGQIELGLERVRARAMAMQKSEELSELVAVLFEELTKLNLILYRCIIWIFNPDTLSARIWMANSEDKKNAESYFIKQLNHPYYKAIINGWKEKNPKWVYVLEGNEKKSIDQLLLHETELSRLSEAVKTGILSSTHTIISGSFNNFGFIEASGPVQQSDEQLDILSRFGKVFDLTYTRFNDLKQAEAQAREAQIEASLERIRSQAMIMRKSEELIEVCKTLLTELQHLGFENIRNTQIAIANDAKGSYMNYDYYNNGISFVGEILYNSHPFIASLAKKMRQNKEAFITVTVEGAELDDWRNHLKNLIQRPAPKLDAATSLNYYYYSIGPGGLGFCTYTPLNEEAMNVLKRFKNVFELTYQRYTDVELAMQYGRQAEQDLIKLQTEKKRAEDALTELQATQKQLIQSEKMASLGELTAGIAHEIQNPLNFVNNFSEVNSELIKELKSEVINGNMNEVAALANDIESNSEKINHHGKRADAIVKGMLQHSRSSSGNKEPTDINALCDEYIRLCYHGLRAKDKSFNATIKTDFDNSIGKVNIIPQDIGRVILNLLTNAFYAVDEKKKLNIPGYDPTVTVSTGLLTPPSGGTGAEIKVADNGNGIPQKVLDKIFQPFFTTKPTGQGTGLGLSLSYDIVKAHGGEIEVETNEEEGTSFIIKL